MSEKETVKVRTEVVSRFGKSIIVNSHSLTFDGEGITELPIDIAEDVVSAEVGIFYVDQEKAINLAKENASGDIKTLSKQVDRLAEENKALKEENGLLKEENNTLKSEIEALIKEKSELELKLEEGEEDQNTGSDIDEENPFNENSLEECQGLCVEAKYPKKEWKDLDESGVRLYLFNKLKEEELANKE